VSEKAKNLTELETKTQSLPLEISGEGFLVDALAVAKLVCYSEGKREGGIAHA